MTQAESTRKCSLLVHFCARLLGGVRAASILFQLHRPSCVISKISGGGNCVTSLAHFGGGRGVGLGQHIIRDERVVPTLADKTVAEVSGRTAPTGRRGQGGGRRLRMRRTATRRHIWNKTREPVIFARMEGAGGTSRRAVATKARHAAHERAHSVLSAPHVQRAGTAAFPEPGAPPNPATSAQEPSKNRVFYHDLFSISVKNPPSPPPPPPPSSKPRSGAAKRAGETWCVWAGTHTAASPL